MKTCGRRSGFTLIEILVFIAIFSIIIVSFITILTTVTQLQIRQSSAAYVAEQSQSLIQQIRYYVKNARIIVENVPLDTPTSTLVFFPPSPSVWEASILLSNGTVYFDSRENDSVPPITSDRVTVSNLLFTRHFNTNGSSSAFGSDSVSFSFTMSAGVAHTAQFYSQSFQSSVAMSTPVPVIEPVSTSGFQGGRRTINGVNEIAGVGAVPKVGDLLLLVVGSTPSSTFSINDWPTEQWNKIVDVLYPAYNSELSIFETVSATSSWDSPLITFDATSSAMVSEAAMFDYRGTATSSPLDVSSSEIQSNTQTPDSGVVHPTSSIELLFGVTANPSTIEVPSPGPGFTLEAETGQLHPPINIYVEDKTQYVTGPVSAGWQYSQTTPSSSLSLILTFK